MQVFLSSSPSVFFLSLTDITLPPPTPLGQWGVRCLAATALSALRSTWASVQDVNLDTSELFCWSLVLWHPIKVFKASYRFLWEFLSFICKVGTEFTNVGIWFIYSKYNIVLYKQPRVVLHLFFFLVFFVILITETHFCHVLSSGIKQPKHWLLFFLFYQLPACQTWKKYLV